MAADAPRPPGPAGPRVLVVEDEYMIATTLRDELAGAGVEVVGPVASVALALALIGQGPPIDGAILDVNLGGEMAWPVVEALLLRRVPLVLATGYDDQAIPDRFAGVPRCCKPAGLRALLRGLAGQGAGVRTA